MASQAKPARPGKTEFSIDEFFGEIEKAEDERLAKRLPQERLRNKRALDQAARREREESAERQAAERESRGFEDQAVEPIVPGKAETSRRTGAKGKRSEATGMQLKAPKSKANSVVRPTNLDGFGEAPQAGFGHVPSAKARSASPPARGKSSVTGGSGATLAGAQTVGISATVKALEEIILNGRKEVEGNKAWMPHRPTRPSKSEGGIPFRLQTAYQPAGDQPTAIADLVEAKTGSVDR